MDRQLQLLDIVRLIYKKRQVVLITVLVTFIISVIVSLLLPNYYKATTTFYAASTDLSKPEQFFGGGSKLLEYYGNEDDIERILTIAQSNELLDFMVDSFHLYSHYRIDSTHEKALYNVRTHFNKLYQVDKTKFGAIELSIEDKRRNFSSAMTNAARDKINQISQHLTRISQEKLVSTLKENITAKEKMLSVMGDSISHLRKEYGIYNIGTQTELISEMVTGMETKLSNLKAQYEVLEKSPDVRRDTLAFIRAKIKGMEKEFYQLQDTTGEYKFNLKRFNEGVSKLQVLLGVYEQASRQMSYDKERLNQLTAAYEAQAPGVLLLTPAEIPVVKSRPKRMIIVLASCLAAFFFSIIGVIFYESYKDFQWE